ncbi:TPA: hypothetical protein REU56_002925, partial [Listeria monocytogenes]|nr:hypothetical protein [Listeria monocytogenes]
METHDNRVYLSQGQTLYFSALRKADDWTTVNDSGSIIVETSDAYPITGLIAGSARLTVFKKNSIHELFGTNPSNFQMTTVTENIGCPTGNTAQVIEGVIYFLGNDAVYRYSGGSLPSSVFSEPIKKTLKTINKNYSYKSISWNDGRKYYLGFPTGSNNYPDTFLEYDTMYGTWNTWTFNYPPTTSGVLYDGNVYLGHLNSGIVKLDPTAQMDTIFLGNFGISYEWTSKPFTFSSMAAKTRWFKLWLSANVPNGTTLTVSLAS